MLHARSLPVLRICLSIVSVMMWSATVEALSASADPSRASSRSYKTTSVQVSKRQASGRKSSAARQVKCAAVAGHAKRRHPRMSCPDTKSRNFTKPSGPKKGPSSSLASPGTHALANAGSSPEEVSEPTDPEVPGLLESPEGSGLSPGGSIAPSEPTPVSGPVVPVQPSTPFRFFSPSSFWNTQVPADAPLDPSSAAVVGALDEEIAAEERSADGPWINTTRYSVPVYTVPAGQPTVPVQLHGRLNVALSSAWSAVPLPSSAEPAVGTDADLFVWQPSTNRLWEFWRLVHGSEGWSASWGGAMQNVSSDQGVYGPEAWPGAQTWWGVSASSLSLVGGLISLEDLKLGQINHALAMAIPDVRGGVHASPAQRSDGKSSDPLSLPEGAHLRLNPNLDLAALHLPRLTLMIAEAAQRYGIFITDGSPIAEFYAQDPSPTGTEPYKGPSGYFEGKYPSQLLASFPWSQLELLKMELHKTK
jgi:hypothetical protein